MKIRKISKKVDQRKLDAFEELFVKEYLKDFNATGALRRCGKSYSSYSVHRKVACELLAKPHVQQEIEKQFKKRTDKVDIDVEFVLRQLKLMAESDVKDAFKKDGSIKNLHDMPDGLTKMISSIETEHPITKPGYKVVKIKFWPKDRGLDMLGKYLAMWIDKKLIGSGDVDDKEFAKKFFGL